MASFLASELRCAHKLFADYIHLSANAANDDSAILVLWDLSTCTPNTIKRNVS